MASVWELRSAIPSSVAVERWWTLQVGMASHAKNAKGTFPRHEECKKLLKVGLDRAQVAATLEPLGLDENNELRPDGTSLFPWSMGKCMLFDFTCHDTLCQSSIQQTSQAAEKAERDERTKYRIFDTDFIVIPVAAETLGSWGPEGLTFVEEIGARITTITGDKRETSHLFQSLGIAIQRGNIISILGSIPNSKLLPEPTFCA